MLIFGLSRLVGDPRDYYLDEYATQEQYEAWGKAMGLDKPLVVQYVIWASKAVRGEFGQSLRHRREALDVVAETVPATLQLSGVGFLVVIIIGIPLGSAVSGKARHLPRLCGQDIRPLQPGPSGVLDRHHDDTAVCGNARLASDRREGATGSTTYFRPSAWVRDLRQACCGWCGHRC